MSSKKKNNVVAVFLRGLRIVGNIQSRVLLTVVYFVLLLPLGILTRFFSDSLTAKPKDRCRSSYWKTSEAETQKNTLDWGRRQY